MPWLISRVGLLLAPLAFLPWSVPKEEVPPRINELFESRQVVFGFTEGNRIICDLMGEQPDYELAYLVPQHMIERGFAPLPIDSFPKSSAGHVGDTLMALWPKGVCRFVIDSIGFYSQVCHDQFAYLLRPIDTVGMSSGNGGTFLFLRESVHLYGPVIPYARYEVQDSTLCAFEDSIEAIVRQKQGPPPPRSIARFRAEYYGVQSISQPDTLFMTVHGTGFSTEWCWHAVFLLIRTAEGWIRSPVIELGHGHFYFNIKCSFDLDGDGLREFLIGVFPGASVYQLHNGRLVPLMHGGPGSC